jgi:N-dimethylarginine dimethylaminohydrolase
MRAISLVLEQYANLGKALLAKGVRIANLSNESVIESWPKMTLEEFETI